MPDVRGEKVERYKLTKEQIGFQNNFRQLKKVEKVLRVATEENTQKAQELSVLWEELNQGFKQLQYNAPKKATKELPGMDFKELSEERTEGVPENWEVGR